VVVAGGGDCHQLLGGIVGPARDHLAKSEQLADKSPSSRGVKSRNLGLGISPQRVYIFVAYKVAVCGRSGG